MDNDTALFAPLAAFRTPEAPRLLTRSVFGSALAVSEVSGPAGHGMTDSIPYQRAYLVQLRLRTCERATYFIDGRAIDTSDHLEGAIQFHDLRSDPRVELADAFHVMHVNVPLSALEMIGEDLRMPRTDELASRPGECHRDAVIEHLLRAMRPALFKPAETSALFLDHVSTALCMHLAQNYAGAHSRLRLNKGGLAPWQERRAKELLESELDRDISLLELSIACGLSVRQFTRAFKQSLGVPPYHYRMLCRMNRARTLLKENKAGLAEIALQCGFASQSHFTRSVHQCTGLSPSDWRRQYGASSPLIIFANDAI